MAEPLTPKIIQELPEKCDTCDSDGEKEPFTQVKDLESFGRMTLVVGYICLECGTGHLYR